MGIAVLAQFLPFPALPRPCRKTVNGASYPQARFVGVLQSCTGDLCCHLLAGPYDSHHSFTALCPAKVTTMLFAREGLAAAFLHSSRLAWNGPRGQGIPHKGNHFHVLRFPYCFTSRTIVGRSPAPPLPPPRGLLPFSLISMIRLPDVHFCGYLLQEPYPAAKHWPCQS